MTPAARSGGRRAVCRDCDQEVLWLTTRLRGTPIAVDPSPDPYEGTVVIAFVDGGRAYVDVLTGDDLTAAQADGAALFMVHARTCPTHKPLNPRPAHVRLDLPPRRHHRGSG